MRKLILAGVLSLLTAGMYVQAAQTTTFVDGRSGPWLSELNPSFDWGDAILPPDVVDAGSGLAITPGAAVTITYVSGGGGFFDNSGGLTVLVQTVPERSAALLLLAGIAFIGLCARGSAPRT